MLRTACRGIALSCAILCLSFPGGRALAQKAPGEGRLIVRTTEGAIRGAFERGVLAFKGIPYAKPPVGKLRWRAPRPAPKWKGVRDATRYGAACIQRPGLSKANGGDPGRLSEDCLYLNLWTPRTKPSAKLPVMVWIHGGAYRFGAGGLPIYTGAPLAKRGAVFVNLNYRLGYLGFFAHPALENGNPNTPVNFGLLDQIAALKWVQRNISRFGGDPDNVTIMGQSAGARSVLALFASPLARGLFHKGIAQSSYVIPDSTREKALEFGVKVAAALGLNGAKARLAELRKIPAKRFGRLRGKDLSMSPVPVVGDKVLPRSIANTFAAGKQAPVPLIVGSTSDDASVIAALGFSPKTILDRLGVARIFMKALYPKARNNSEVAREALRDLVFTMPARWIADRHSMLAPTWRYYFDYTARRERRKFPAGVPHGGEVMFFLDTGDIYEGTRRIFTKRDQQFSRVASDYWFQFARTGRPVSKLGPKWPGHKRASRDRILKFADKTHVIRNFMRSRLNVFIGATKLVDVIFQR